MQTIYRPAALAAAWLLAGFPNIALAGLPPIEAFGQRPALVDVDLNPAGTRLALIEDDGKASRVVIHELASGRDLRTLNTPPGNKLHSVSWANDETLLIEESVTYAINDIGATTDEWQRWVAVDATGGTDRMLLMSGGERKWVNRANLIRRHISVPDSVLMSTLDFSETDYRSETGSRLSGGRKDSGWVWNLFVVNLNSGDGKIVESGTPFTTGWLADAAVEHVVRADWNPKTNQYDIYAKDAHNWRRVYRATNCGQMRLVGLTADDFAILALGTKCGEERSKLWKIPYGVGAPQALFEDAAFDAEGVVTDPLDGTVMGVSLGDPAQTIHWLDADAERRSASLHKTFPAKWESRYARSTDARRVIVRVEDQARPPIYYLVDYDRKSADIISEAYPKLTGVTLGSVRELRYEARDKYALMAYLTVPAGLPEKKLPVVVLPHGGPESRDGTGFDWIAQFLASRGYAVLQPQFRGSSGFGSAHANAGRHQWGLLMQDDVTDGVQALIAQGIADPQRICIMGWSYGGYAALAGAAFTPELYRCAVSIAGVSDLPAMLGYSAKFRGKESDSLDYWRDHIGAPSDPQVIAKSPARAAAAIRAPILLLHGTDDTVVPIEQSRTMARALKAANRQYQFVELPGQDHQVETSAARVRMLTEVEKFLGKYLAAPADSSTH